MAEHAAAPLPDIETTLYDTMTERRREQFRIRKKALEEIAAIQDQAGHLETQLQEMTYQRDLALAREAALAADRDHWRCIAEWSEEVIAGRERYIAKLHDRYHRLRAAREQDRQRLAWSMVWTFLLCLVTLVVLLAGPLLTALGVVVP